MTILEISILFHYRCSPTDYRNGDFSAPAVREAMDRFLGHLCLLRFDSTYPNRRYSLTSRGEFYVDALQVVPLPEQVWAIPEAVGAP